MTRKHITIYDLAQEAGVSPATVSRILNGNSSVRSEKRDKVNELIEKYNFHPNAMARALSDTKTHMIGMVMADTANPYYSSLFTACVEAANKRGYSVMMFNTLSRAELEQAALTRLREQRADAIIISGGRIDLNKQDPDFTALINKTIETIPVVVASKSRSDRIFGIAVDHTASMDIALDHLIGLGHTKIGFLYAGKENYGTQEKLERFRARMEKANLEVREEWLIPLTLYDSEAGRAGVDKLMTLDEKPTALLGINDLVAAGMLQRLLSYGIKVPDDISMIGFDDTFITNITTPELTAVSYDYNEFASMLLDAVEASINQTEKPVNRLVPPSLFVKGSCAPPPKTV